MKTFIFYIAVINILAFLIMGVDKYKAQRHQWRISENSIFALALIGGAIGAFAGMSVFRHKTKHLKFTLGIPAAIILNLATFGYIFQKLGFFE